MIARAPVLLAVDPGKTSGAALFVRGDLAGVSTVDVADSSALNTVVWHALQLSSEYGPLIMVGETWGKGGPRGMKQWQGLGAAWKRWQWALEEGWAAWRAEHPDYRKAPRMYKPQTATVHTSTWRSKIFGRRMSKEQAKRMAVWAVASRYDIKLEPQEHDAAEAVLIGTYAQHDKNVLAKLPKGWTRESCAL